jgi:hypothetical protein
MPRAASYRFAQETRPCRRAARFERIRRAGKQGDLHWVYSAEHPYRTLLPAARRRRMAGYGSRTLHAAICADYSLVRYAHAVGNHRWPERLTLPWSVQRRPQSSLWSDMVIMAHVFNPVDELAE